MRPVIAPIPLPAMFPNHLVDAKLALRASEPILVVGKKRARAEKEIPARPVKKNRQDDVLKAMGDKPVTERHILETVGDNRYTREILRRLMAVKVVQRMGRGGSNDPFLYRVVRSASEVLEQGIIDPASDIRMQRIENKILALLAEEEGFVTEKQIRAVVGDNTGTGKALRRLVKNSRVLRVGRGGAGDPFTYQANHDADVPFSLAQNADDKTKDGKPTAESETSSSTASPASYEELEESKLLSDRSTVPSSSHSVTDEAADDCDFMDDIEDEAGDKTGSVDFVASVMDKLKHGSPSHGKSHLDHYLSTAAVLEREMSSDSHSEEEMDDFGIADDVALVDDDDASDIQDVPEGMSSMAPWASQAAVLANPSDVASSSNNDGDNFVDSFLV